MSKKLVMRLVPIALVAIVFPIAVAAFPKPASVRDAYGYVITAQRLASGGGYAYGIEPLDVAVAPNARVEPGWPVLLSGTFAISGVGGSVAENAERARPLMVFVLFLCTVGIVAAITLSGVALGGDRLGILAGIMAALYLPFSWASTVALAEQLGAVVLAWAIYVALLLARPSERAKTGWLAGALGVLCALLVLTRANMIVWTLAPLAYVALRRVYEPRRLLTLASIGLAAGIVVMAPWWVRNAAALDRFVPFKSDYQPAASQSQSAETTRAALPQSDAPVVVPTGLGDVLTREMLPWVPYFEVILDSTWREGLGRIEYPQRPSQFPVPVTDGLVSMTMVYHRLIWALALLSLVFVRKSPRLLILLAAPVAILVAHGSTMTVRYLYPSMVAVVLMAAAGAYGLYLTARKRLVSG